MYFDIEYPVKNNEEKISQEIVMKIIEIFSSNCKKMYDISCSSNNVIVLNSSTDLKISYHLIFKSVIFTNNRSCKDFIKFVLENISSADHLMLSAFDSSFKSVLVIDMTVYSRYQNFRIVQSSKFGKNSPLIPVDKNFDNISVFDEDAFVETLVCDKNLVVNTVIHDDSLSLKKQLIEGSAAPLHPKISSKQKNKSSDNPFIDKIVESQIGNGRIRSITKYENEGTNKPMLIYEITNYSFCDNINRAHRNNNIYFVGDISRMCIYKKCHDPDCRGFRGKDIFV